MNKKFLLSVVVLFVLAMGLGFVVHGMLLHEDYAKLPNLMRPEEDAMGRFHFMILAHVLIAVAMTWVYVRGREDKPWLGQGIRFGLAVALLAPIPTYLIYHVVAPYPLDLALKQIVFDGLGMVVLGIAAAGINRP